MNKIIALLIILAIIAIFITGYVMGARFGAKTIAKKIYVKDTVYLKNTAKTDTVYKPAIIDTSITPYVATDTTKIRTQGLDMGTLITKYTYMPKNEFTYIWDIKPIIKKVHIIDTLTIKSNSCIMRGRDMATGAGIATIAISVLIGYLLVYGFGNFDVNLGTIILATELFFALVINALILKEIPTAYEIVGGLLIFSGTVVTSLKLNGDKSSSS